MSGLPRCDRKSPSYFEGWSRSALDAFVKGRRDDCEFCRRERELRGGRGDTDGRKFYGQLLSIYGKELEAAETQIAMRS